MLIYVAVHQSEPAGGSVGVGEELLHLTLSYKHRQNDVYHNSSSSFLTYCVSSSCFVLSFLSLGFMKCHWEERSRYTHRDTEVSPSIQAVNQSSPNLCPLTFKPQGSATFLPHPHCLLIVGNAQRGQQGAHQIHQDCHNLTHHTIPFSDVKSNIWYHSDYHVNYYSLLRIMLNVTVVHVPAQSEIQIPYLSFPPTFAQSVCQKVCPLLLWVHIHSEGYIF